MAHEGAHVDIAIAFDTPTKGVGAIGATLRVFAGKDAVVRVTTIQTAILHGMEALPVRVEVSTSAGIPGITMVGLPDSAVLESRSRIRCATRAPA